MSRCQRWRSSTSFACSPASVGATLIGPTSPPSTEMRVKMAGDRRLRCWGVGVTKGGKGLADSLQHHNC